MSSLIYRLAHTCYRARRRVVAAWLAILIGFGVLTATIGGKFDDEFTIPGAPAQIALDQLMMTFEEAADSSAIMLVVAAPDTNLDNPIYKREIDATLAQANKISWVKGTQSPYNEYVEGMISDSKQAAYAQIRVAGSMSTFTDAQRDELRALGAELQQRLPGSEVHFGGTVFTVNMPTLSVVELIGVGVALIVLLITLGSVRAAVMPLISAIIGAGLSMMLIVISAGLMTVNSTTMILALMLALAVGIDYSLFIVSRHRDQLAEGMDVEESAARATATAGSAVVFAGATVVIALFGLAIANIPFLTIMGVFAAIAVTIEVALALTFLPAMLGFAGERLRPTQKQLAKAKSRTFNPFAWWVNVVTKKPLITIAVVVAALGVLAIPAKDLHMALPDSGQSEPGAPDRVTYDLIAKHFGTGANGPLIVTGQIVESNDPLFITRGLQADIEKMPGVAMVAISTPNMNADTAMVQIIPTTGPNDPATADLVDRLRAKAPEWKERYNIDTAVTGYTAVSLDITQRLGNALLPFGLFVVGLSLVLLTMVFRSIAVPVKAALGYVLSVAAAFGATTLVFNKGWFMSLVNLPETVPVISFLPIVLMGILFGLAMDYEVFLSSRMREEFVHGNQQWVRDGFIHTAKVVVAAGIIMVAVFAFFVPTGGGIIKPIAFGLAVGIGIDAFLVRMTIGPAIMKLLGDKAWYVPVWLERRMPVLDVEGEALAHQLSLADWPQPNAPGSIYFDNVTVADRHRTVVDGIDVTVNPGQTLVVVGQAQTRNALLLTLAGRLRVTEGRAKVLGYALPEEAPQLRGRTTWVDGAVGLPTAVQDLVVVPDAHRCEGHVRQELAVLAASLGERTLVVAAPSIEAVADLTLSNRVVLDVDASIFITSSTIESDVLVGGTL